MTRGGNDSGDMPLKLVQLSKTRWLAWARAIKVILDQWLELKTYFGTIATATAADDKSTIGRKLNECYSNETNHLMLLFPKPITEEINDLNLKFQATEAEVKTM